MIDPNSIATLVSGDTPLTRMLQSVLTMLMVPPDAGKEERSRVYDEETAKIEQGTAAMRAVTQGIKGEIDDVDSELDRLEREAADAART